MKTPFQLEPDIFVSGQIALQDIERFHRLGIRTIVSNRPDEELDDQPTSKSVGEAAARLGISFRYRPVWGFELTDPEVQEAVWQSFADEPGPVLLYCRSGRRSTLLWARQAIRYLDPETVRARALRAGIETEELDMVLGEFADLKAA